MRVLFTGYAPVHFLCFKPLYEWLTRRPDVDVVVSGGLRRKVDGTVVYDLDAMYGPLNVPHAQRAPVESIQEMGFDIVFAANTKMILPREHERTVQIFHGISFRNKAVRSANLAADHYFLAGSYMRRRFADANLLAPDDPRGLPIGFMKTDALVNDTLNRKTLLQRYGLSGDRPIVLYAPTGQRYNSLEIMGEDVLATLAGSDQFDSLIKLHDHPKKMPADVSALLERYESDRLRVPNELDVIPLLYLADVLITDASSVSNEFALRNRPMVFLDVPKLIRRAQKAEESAMDLDTWGRKCGTVVSDSSEMLYAIDRGLNHRDEGAEIRSAMVKDLFYNPGRATDAAVKWCESVIAEARAPTVTR